MDIPAFATSGADRSPQKTLRTDSLRCRGPATPRTNFSDLSLNSRPRVRLCPMVILQFQCDTYLGVESRAADSSKIGYVRMSTHSSPENAPTILTDLPSNDLQTGLLGSEQQPSQVSPGTKPSWARPHSVYWKPWLRLTQMREAPLGSAVPEPGVPTDPNR